MLNIVSILVALTYQPVKISVKAYSRFYLTVTYANTPSATACKARITSTAC
jgi:hypothetical protein